MMEEEFIARQRPAWASVFLLILAGIAGFIFIGFLIGFMIAIPFMEGSPIAFIDQIAHPSANPQIKGPLLIIQSCVTFFGLAVLPALYWYGSEKRNPFLLLRSQPTPFFIFILTAMIIVSFLPVNSLFIDWNSHVRFPDFLGGFDSWARKKEADNQELITLFTTFNSFGQFLFALFSISILAGFSEELFFRGMLQPVMKAATGNIHVAIWITAILFSALHLEFFGFIPRVLLGALFGYIYYWSGNLWLAMVGHMVNNGLSVIALYVNQKEKLNLNLDDTDAVPLPVMIGGTVVFSLLMFYFYRFYKTSKLNAA